MGVNYQSIEKLTDKKELFCIDFAERLIGMIDNSGSDDLLEIELGAIPGPEDTYDDYTIDLFNRFLIYLEEKELISNLARKCVSVSHDEESGLDTVDFTYGEDVWHVTFNVKKKETLKEFLVDFIFKLGYKNGHKITYKKGILTINGKKVEIRKGKITDSDKLLNTLMKNFNREWTTEEILEDWGIDIEADTPPQKLLQAAIKINNKVAKATGMRNFLIAGTECIKINNNF